nr:unnamed protein product [Leishmania braziliensis]
MAVASSSLPSTCIIDATMHFEGRRGRRTFPEKNASQIRFGGAAANSHLEEQEGVVRRQAQTPAPVSWQHQQERPTRRPRGPGTTFAAHIEANGFPAAASRRSARVDVAPECLYQYDTSKLHTHKRLTQMPNRVKQCNRTLQLFLQPQEQVARSAAAAAMLGESQDGPLLSSLYPSLQGQAHRRDPRMIVDAARTSSRSVTDSAPHDSATMAACRPCLPWASTEDLDHSPLSREAESADQQWLLEYLDQREFDRLREACHPVERHVDAVVDEDARAQYGQVAVPTLPSGVTPLSFRQVDSANIAAIAPPQRRRAKRRSGGRDDGDGAMYAHPLKSRDRQPWEREYALEAHTTPPRTRSSHRASVQNVGADENREGNHDRNNRVDNTSTNTSGEGMYTPNGHCTSSSPPRQIMGPYTNVFDRAEAHQEPPKRATCIVPRTGGVASATPPVPRTSAWFVPLRRDRIVSPTYRSRCSDHVRASYSFREEKERQADQCQTHASVTSPALRRSPSFITMPPTVRWSPPPPQRSLSTTAEARPATASSSTSARTRAMVTLHDVCTYQQSRAPSLQQQQHWRPTGSASPSPLVSTSSACAQGRDNTAPTLRDVYRALRTSAAVM